MIVVLQAFNSNFELTEASNLKMFFKHLLGDDRDGLLDRLYKRYIKQEELNSTILLLKSELCKRNCIDNKLLEKLINACERGANYVNLSFKTFNVYEPLRLVILNEPYFSLSLDIPLEDYDNNEGEPFWMRPEYIIEKYGKNTHLQVDTMTPTSYEHKATYKDGRLLE